MGDGLVDDIPEHSGYQVRRYLSVIHTQAEVLLEEYSIEGVERSGLQRILRSCYELDAVVGQQTGPELIRSLPSTVSLDALQHILVWSQNKHLRSVIGTGPTETADLTVQRVETIDEAEAIASARSVDLILVDAVWPENTGLALVRQLHDRIEGDIPFALLSVYSADRTPLALAASGVLDPQIGTAELEEALEPFAISEVAGFLTESPGDPLGATLAAATETSFAPTEQLVDQLTTTVINADALCLDPDVYRALSSTELENLRTMAPGRGRPIFLVDSTAADPWDRGWIPTLGARRFLHRPPDLVRLISTVLAHRQSDVDATA